MNIERDPKQVAAKRRAIEKMQRAEAKRCRAGIRETGRTYEGVVVREAPPDRAHGMNRMRGLGASSTLDQRRQSHEDTRKALEQKGKRSGVCFMPGCDRVATVGAGCADHPPRKYKKERADG